ncbi:conserved protein of unknown function [Tenacibaculum sp. 190524A02b]|uniref:hypothetical protein n=1 Tax=Tenacibaculum vairaonense TaxID=3137860 RepID=UPI0032B199A1
MKKVYVGIDPDIDKSGFDVWDKNNLNLRTLCFWDLVNELYSLNKTSDLKVMIEAGWLIKKSNWHKSNGKLQSEKIAKNVGMNHQTGILIKEFCEYKNIKFELVKPKGKLKAETFNKITNYQGRTNQEKRDAAMLVFGM